MGDHAALGAQALEAKQNDAAIKHYTAALKQAPESPMHYIRRSTGYQRLNLYNEALADAEKAVVLATKRARSEQIGEAQLRRGIALYFLGRYGDAEFVLSLATKKIKGHKTLEASRGIWEKKIASALLAAKEKYETDKKDEQGEEVEENEEDKKEREKKIAVSVKAVPDIDTAVPPPSTQTSSMAKTEPAPPAASKPTQTPASQIRHEWYQGAPIVTITVFAKGIPADKLTVDIQERSLEISFPLTSGSDYQLQFDPLFAAVDASKSQSTYKLYATKLEITLKKSVEGQKWPALEGTAGNARSTTTTTTGINAAARSAALSNTATGPSYPTSSKSGPKNWDKIAKSYAKPPRSAKTGSKNGAGTPPSSDNDDNDSDANEAKDTSKPPAASKPKQKKKTTKKDPDDPIYVSSDSDAGDEVNGFFKTMYKNADPDTRRAMMKSYQESGGTALSTNWDEVSKGTVPVSPPDGMEEKKY